MKLDTIIIKHIVKVLLDNDLNVAKSSKILGKGRQFVYRWLNKYKLVLNRKVLLSFYFKQDKGN